MYKILYLPSGMFIPQKIGDIATSIWEHTNYKDKLFYTEKDAQKYIRDFLRILHKSQYQHYYQALYNAFFNLELPIPKYLHSVLYNFYMGKKVKFVFTKLIEISTTSSLQTPISFYPTPNSFRKKRLILDIKKPQNIYWALSLLLYLEKDEKVKITNCQFNIPKILPSYFLIIKC